MDKLTSRFQQALGFGVAGEGAGEAVGVQFAHLAFVVLAGLAWLKGRQERVPA